MSIQNGALQKWYDCDASLNALQAAEHQEQG